jgi:hypothetical protein
VPQASYHVQQAALAAFLDKPDALDTACQKGGAQMAANIGEGGELVRGSRCRDVQAMWRAWSCLAAGATCTTALRVLFMF